MKRETTLKPLVVNPEKLEVKRYRVTVQNETTGEIDYIGHVSDTNEEDALSQAHATFGHKLKIDDSVSILED